MYVGQQLFEAAKIFVEGTEIGVAKYFGGRKDWGVEGH